MRKVFVILALVLFVLPLYPVPVSASNVNVSFLVELQGNRTPEGYDVPLTMKFYTQPVTSANILTIEPVYTFTTDDNLQILGVYQRHLVVVAWDVPYGVYNITLYSPQCLVSLINNVTTYQGWQMDFGVLYTGDAKDITEGSKTIDIMDFGVWSTANGSTPASHNWDARADFDRNGIVNYTDLDLLIANYGKNSPYVAVL